MKFFALFALIAMIAVQAFALPAPAESEAEAPAAPSSDNAAAAKSKRAVLLYSAPLTTYHFPHTTTFYSSYVPSLYHHYPLLV